MKHQWWSPGRVHRGNACICNNFGIYRHMLESSRCGNQIKIASRWSSDVMIKRVIIHSQAKNFGKFSFYIPVHWCKFRMQVVLCPWELQTQLKQPFNAGGEENHAKTLHSLWGRGCIPSWQCLFPRDAHLHFLIFSAGVHFVKCFLNIYSWQFSHGGSYSATAAERKPHCFSCWDILSSSASRSANFPRGATCWVTEQTSKQWELFVCYRHVQLIMVDVSSRTNEINNSTPPPTS